MGYIALSAERKSRMSEKVEVDARGRECPVPVVMTLNTMKELKDATQVVTLVDNPTAVENLQKLGSEKNVATSVATVDDHFEVSFDVPEGGIVSADSDDAFITSCGVAQKKNVVVQLSSDAMGAGDDALGRQLMKGFIYALSQLDELPQTILLYNGGAKLSVEGSDALDDLKNLEAEGVEVLTCGTCLNHYGLADKLAVGGVTNMYVIAEKLAKASLIVRP